MIFSPLTLLTAICICPPYYCGVLLSRPCRHHNTSSSSTLDHKRSIPRRTTLLLRQLQPRRLSSDVLARIPSPRHINSSFETSKHIANVSNNFFVLPWVSLTTTLSRPLCRSSRATALLRPALLSPHVASCPLLRATVFFLSSDTFNSCSMQRSSDVREEREREREKERNKETNSSLFFFITTPKYSWFTPGT